MMQFTGVKGLIFLLELAFVFDGFSRIVGNALSLRAPSKADSTIAAPTPAAVTPLTDGRVVEMSAGAFLSVSAWCTMYQAQWQTNNRMCLNKELVDAFKQAAARGQKGLFDFRTYTGLEVQRSPDSSGATSPVQPVNDPNSPTHAMKYIYGTICTGELNYACKKILEVNVRTATTDNTGVPSSKEVDMILRQFDEQTPKEAAARAEAEEKMLPTPPLGGIESGDGAQATPAEAAENAGQSTAGAMLSEEGGTKGGGATDEADDDLIAGSMVEDQDWAATSADDSPPFPDEASDPFGQQGQPANGGEEGPPAPDQEKPGFVAGAEGTPLPFGSGAAPADVTRNEAEAAATASAEK